MVCEQAHDTAIHIADCKLGQDSDDGDTFCFVSVGVQEHFGPHCLGSIFMGLIFQ